MTAFGIRDPMSGPWVRRGSVQFRIWFTLLLASITLEGLGRRFLPGIPSLAFYFAKDVVLVAGLLLVGLGRAEVQQARSLITGFTSILILAFSVTVLQLANPAQTSAVLGAIGLKAYWLWWLAPLIVARALAAPGDLEFAISLSGGLGHRHLRVRGVPVRAVRGRGGEPLCMGERGHGHRIGA